MKFKVNDGLFYSTSLDYYSSFSPFKDEIFQRLEEGTSLKEICIIDPIIKSTIGMIGLSKVSPEALGGGLSRNRIVKLHRVTLTAEQKQSLLKNIER